MVYCTGANVKPLISDKIFPSQSVYLHHSIAAVAWRTACFSKKKNITKNKKLYTK